jgi:hypothetical protein
VRIFVMGSGAVMVAIITRRPPQSAQRRTSTAKTRSSSSAQGWRRSAEALQPPAERLRGLGPGTTRSLRVAAGASTP